MGASPAMGLLRLLVRAAPLYPAGAGRPARPELAWADQTNWHLTIGQIRPKWLGRGTGVNIPLDRDNPTALPRQIQTHLERLIHERLLTPGTKLPATRELARQLRVNRGTVALAYEELVAAGWARAHVGQGTFVAGPPAGAAAPAAPPAARPLNWSALLSRSARIVESDGERARAAAPGAVRDGVISFA